jgi:transposase
MSFYDERTYQDKNVLENMLLQGLSAKQIAKELHVSYKLINLWLVKHNLVIRSSEMTFP